MKIRGCSLATWAAHDTLFLTFRGFYHHHHHHNFVVLFVGAEMETVHSGFTLKLRHRGRSSEVRDQSFPSLSLLLSFSLFSPSLSLSCRSSSSLIGVQSADSPIMADGGRGWGGWNAGTFQSGQQFFITAFLQDSIVVKALFHIWAGTFIAPSTCCRCPLVAGQRH